jgi:CubicO group peptidase (beta-lactamase class C family)
MIGSSGLAALAWWVSLAGQVAPGIDPTSSSEKAAVVDSLFAGWNRPEVPGCAVGVIFGGQLVYAKGFGTANVEDGVPNTPQTLFEVGSASKSFPCACIALLMDAGKVSPDDDLSKFVPEMHRFEPPIRIRDLLQCRTGLLEPFHIMPLCGWDNVPIHSPYSQEDVIAVLCGQRRLPFAPGSQFHYSSGDYFMLGLIVERASGQPLAEFARTRLFDPLGMNHTFFETEPSLAVGTRAVGHVKEDGKWHTWRTNAYLPGGGGLKSSIDDLAKWDGNFDECRLPRGKFVDEFLTDGTLLGNRYVLDADAYRREIQSEVENPPAGQYRGRKRIQFTGGVWGMSAAFCRFPDDRLTVICLSNSDELSPFSMTKTMADVYLEGKMEPLPTSPDQPTDFVKLPQENLHEKAGAYRLKREGRIWRVIVRDGELCVVDPIHKTWRLGAMSATSFRPVGETPFYPSARFTFHRDTPQERYSMTLESLERGFHEVLDFERVELAAPSAEELAGLEGE